MREELGGIHFALSNQLMFAHLKWSEYRAIFGSSPERIALLNEAAPTFFHSLQGSMWDGVLLHLTRLTDRSRIVGNETLTLMRLPPLIADEAFQKEVSRLVEEAKEKTKFAPVGAIGDWRTPNYRRKMGKRPNRCRTQVASMSRNLSRRCGMS